MTTPALQLRLVQMRLEAEDVISYEFASIDGRPLPAFTAGSHIDLHLPGGHLRSYSLCNAPAERHRYVIAVRRERESRGGSAWMHDALRVGHTLASGLPVNDFPLAESAPQSVLVAGGIGVTPLLAMARRLEELRQPWQMHYAARSPQSAAFAGELRALGPVKFCFSSAPKGRLNLGALVAAAPQTAHLYCCGPAAMINEFGAACAGRDPATVHVERFGATTAAATEGGYHVVLRRAGQRFEVGPGKTILDTLLDHSVDVQYACSSGVCGTCRTAVVEGIPDHRDDYLTDDEKREGKSIMICCSGARSRELVLDL